MRHLDGIDPRRVQRGGDSRDMVDAIEMADRMHAIAQRDILDIEMTGIGIEHQATRCMSMRPAIFSAVRNAADVMISRLPA